MSAICEAVTRSVHSMSRTMSSHRIMQLFLGLVGRRKPQPPGGDVDGNGSAS